MPRYTAMQLTLFLKISVVNKLPQFPDTVSMEKSTVDLNIILQRLSAFFSVCL